MLVGAGSSSPKRVEELTWWNTILNELLYCLIKSPGSSPVSHCFPRLEMISNVIGSGRPGIHDETAEAAAGSNSRGSNLPGVHSWRMKLAVVYQA
jgi:hypothetical protein